MSSILGRYLEHSRIFYFRNGGKDVVYLGSADLMQWNLNNRVEVIFPVESHDYVRYLREVVLHSFFKDHSQTRILRADGSYKRLRSKEDETPLSVQEWLMAGQWNKNS